MRGGPKFSTGTAENVYSIRQQTRISRQRKYERVQRRANLKDQQAGEGMEGLTEGLTSRTSRYMSWVGETLPRMAPKLIMVAPAQKAESIIKGRSSQIFL